MGFSWQEYWSGLSFPSPVDHILSDLPTMTCPSWVAPHGMAQFHWVRQGCGPVIRLAGFCDYGFSVSALWCPLATPTILLGFLLARTWGSSSRLLQQRTAIAPYLGGGEKSLGAMNRSFLFLKELIAAGHLPAHLSLSILKHKPKALVQSCLFSCWGFCLLTDTMTAWLLVARTVTGYHLKFYSLTITFHLLPCGSLICILPRSIFFMNKETDERAISKLLKAIRSIAAIAFLSSHP